MSKRNLKKTADRISDLLLLMHRL